MGTQETPQKDHNDQEHEAPQDLAAFGVALDEGVVDRDDVAAGNLGEIELADDVVGDDPEDGMSPDGVTGEAVTLLGGFAGEEMQAAVLLDADASPELEVALPMAESDEALDGGEEGPTENESRTDVSTAQLTEEDSEDDDPPWREFSEHVHIAERPWRFVAARGLEGVTASEARIALAPALHEGAAPSAPLEVGPFEATVEGSMAVTPAGITSGGALWLPFVPSALAKLHDEVLVVATDQAGISYVYAGRLDEAPYLVFVLDREDGDADVRDIIEAGDGTVLLRGPFGEIELQRP